MPCGSVIQWQPITYFGRILYCIRGSHQSSTLHIQRLHLFSQPWTYGMHELALYAYISSHVLIINADCLTPQAAFKPMVETISIKSLFLLWLPLLLLIASFCLQKTGPLNQLWFFSSLKDNSCFHSFSHFTRWIRLFLFRCLLLVEVQPRALSLVTLFALQLPLFYWGWFMITTLCWSMISPPCFLKRM